jgi:hypothetical protein
MKMKETAEKPKKMSLEQYKWKMYAEHPRWWTEDKIRGCSEKEEKY